MYSTLQNVGKLRTIGKNFDATGGFGPWLVTTDELPAGCAGLRVQSRLNGKVMQDANTRDFLFDVVEALCLVTECMTLEPGDVIITGTPGGVGHACTPPVWMAAGDVCEIDIEGIGVLCNPIADETQSKKEGHSDTLSSTRSGWSRCSPPTRQRCPWLWGNRAARSIVCATAHSVACGSGVLFL